MPPPDLARLKDLKRQIDEATDPEQRDAAEAVFRENLHAYLLRDARIAARPTVPDQPWQAADPAGHPVPRTGNPAAVLAGTPFTTAELDRAPGTRGPDASPAPASAASAGRADRRERLFLWLRFGIAMVVGALVVWSLSGAFGRP